MNRPPINEATGQAVRCEPYNGHVIQQIGAYLYPCLGCGVERDAPLWSLPCPTPYTDPVADSLLLGETRDALRVCVETLGKIRDEARTQTAILRAMAEAQGVDLEPWRPGPPSLSPPPFSRCRLARGHYGRCGPLEKS